MPMTSTFNSHFADFQCSLTNCILLTTDIPLGSLNISKIEHGFLLFLSILPTDSSFHNKWQVPPSDPIQIPEVSLDFSLSLGFHSHWSYSFTSKCVSNKSTFIEYLSDQINPNDEMLKFISKIHWLKWSVGHTNKDGWLPNVYSSSSTIIFYNQRMQIEVTTYHSPI